MGNITLLLMLICLSCCSDGSTFKTELGQEKLPSFNLLLIDSTTQFNTNNIPVGKPIVLFYFTPVCFFCRAQTEEIIEDMKSLKNILFYIFTDVPLHQLKSYYNHYELKKYSNITVGQDYMVYFGNYFKVQVVPFMAIYSKDKRLKQVLTGKVSTKMIKDLAFE